MRAKKAFSIIELMIVVAVIGVMMSIAIPAYLVYETKARLQYNFNALLSIAKQVGIRLQETGTNDFNNVPIGTGTSGGAGMPDIPYMYYGNGPILSTIISSSAWQVRGYNQNTGLVPDFNLLYVIISIDALGNQTTCCGVRIGSGTTQYLKYFPSGCNNVCNCTGC